jgi:hypothetical protein
VSHRKPIPPPERRCEKSRTRGGKPKLIFETEEAAREYGERKPDAEGQHPYFCARGTTIHWHLTRSEFPEIPGLKRGKLGRRGGNQHRGNKRGLTYRPQNG